MAEYYEVKQDEISALTCAVLKATREDKSMTVYAPVSNHDFFLVGPSSGAADMREAGAVPLFSVQSHAPACYCGESMCCFGEGDAL